MTSNRDQTECYDEEAICLDSDDNESLEVNSSGDKVPTTNEVSLDAYVEELEKRLLNGAVNYEEEAYKLYCDYAHAIGFSVRKGKQYYFNGTKKIKSKLYVCWKEGTRDEKESSSQGNSSFPRLDTRTGCKASVWFSCDKDGVFTVKQFTREHNHEMVKHYERHLLRSVRSVSDANRAVLQGTLNARIPIPNPLEHIARGSCGKEITGFTKKVVHYNANEVKASQIDVGDSQSLVTFFKTKTNEDGFFYWDVQLDHEGRMANFFWRDGRSRVDYNCFGDVVLFDTTYRANKYNLICAPFIGVNHHCQAIMFGCALLTGDTEGTFEWLFKTFMESMGNKPPETIFSNEDQGMSNAIHEGFPETRHHFCQSHILKKVSSHLGSLNSNRDFQYLFHKCMSKCQTEKEFEETWAKMITEHNAHEYTWLNSLFSLRHKWSIAFNKDTLHCGIESTSQSESRNHVFYGLGDNTTSLFELVQGCEKIVKRWRASEWDEDFRCTHGASSRAVKESLMLKQASKIYTNTIYKFFEKEYLKGIGATTYEEKTHNSNLYEYEVLAHGEENSKVKVSINMTTMEVNCCCKKFESMGFLCSHVVKIFVVKNVMQIPEKYILRRWTKDVRRKMHMLEMEDARRGESQVAYSNGALRFAYDLVSRSSSYEGARAIVMETLEDAYRKLDEYLKNLSLDTHFSVRDKPGKRVAYDLCNYSSNGKGNDGEHVLDLRSHWEKRSKKNSTSVCMGKEKEVAFIDSGPPMHSRSNTGKSILPSTPSFPVPTLNDAASLAPPMSPFFPWLSPMPQASFPSTAPDGGNTPTSDDHPH